MQERQQQLRFGKKKPYDDGGNHGGSGPSWWSWPCMVRLEGERSRKKKSGKMVISGK